MAWQGIECHDSIAQKFRAGLSSNRLASAFLFVGPGGIGKRSFALKLAQSLLCETVAAEQLAPCGHCPSCQQVLAGTHPDLEQISKPKGKTRLPIELLIGDKQHRMREGLCARIAMKPVRGGRKIAIIDDADALGIEAANCLLKTLEEPPAGSILILIGTSPQRQLPTIRSRCQLVAFQPLDQATVKRLVIENGIAEDETQANRISELADGSLERAALMSNEEIWSFRSNFYDALGQGQWDSLALAKDVSAFVESAGTDAAARRSMQRIAIDFATKLFRHVARIQVGVPATSDPALQQAAQALANHWSFGPDAAAIAVERCLLAADCVDANANQATNIESWIDDLAIVHRTGRYDTPEIAEIL